MNSNWKQNKINKKIIINENRHQHSGSGKTVNSTGSLGGKMIIITKKTKLCLQPHVETLCLQLCWSFHTFRREQKQSGHERSQRKTCLGLLSLTWGVTGSHSLELLRIDKWCCPSPADENPGTSWRHVLSLLLISSKGVLHSSSEDEKYWKSSRFHPSSWQGEGSNYCISIVSGDERVLTSGGLAFFFLFFFWLTLPQRARERGVFVQHNNNRQNRRITSARISNRYLAIKRQLPGAAKGPALNLTFDCNRWVNRLLSPLCCILLGNEKARTIYHCINPFIKRLELSKWYRICTSGKT